MPATSRLSSFVAGSTSAPTSPETSVATISSSGAAPAQNEVLVRADLVLVGASSVTSVTVKIRRGSGITGTTLATGAFTVSGAVTVPSSLAYVDTAYDGTGYSLTVTAAGAAATVGPGVLEAQLEGVVQDFGH